MKCAEKEAFSTRLEAIASRLEAMATRLETMKRAEKDAFHAFHAFLGSVLEVPHPDSVRDWRERDLYSFAACLVCSCR